MGIRLATVCSGIGAPEVAASALGWPIVFQAETEPFCRSVLQHHFQPEIFYEDFTEINHNAWLGRLDCLVAGTPCQDFSLAGQRQGISGDRGNLTLDFIRLVQKTECEWGILENVPGLLTTDFGFVLNEITGRTDLHRYKHWPTAGIIEKGPSGYSACWRVLNARYFGLPQRRKRVFVVFRFGNWPGPHKTLFEQKGSPRHPQTNIAKRQAIAAGSGESTQGNLLIYETNPTDGRVTPTSISPTLTARMGTGGGQLPLVLSNDNAKASLGVNIVPTILSPQKSGPSPIVLSSSQSKATLSVETLPTLSSRQDKDLPIINEETRLRYLTPLEAERCFGFKDNWTNIPGATKGKRFQALGNSMCIPVIRWILERLGEQHDRHN